MIGPTTIREALLWLWLGLVWLPICEGVDAMKRPRRRRMKHRTWKRHARREARAAWKRLANRSERRTGRTTGSWLGRRRTRPAVEVTER